MVARSLVCVEGQQEASPLRYDNRVSDLKGLAGSHVALHVRSAPIHCKTMVGNFTRRFRTKASRTGKQQHMHLFRLVGKPLPEQRYSIGLLQESMGVLSQ